MQDFGRRYPYPMGVYGESFAQRFRQKHPKPYGNFGNGSAMRVSPCALVAVSLEEALALARASADITHNHPEGIKGAEAVSAAIFRAKSGKTREDIRQYISEHYYDLNFTLEDIRESYHFDGSCQGSVPQAIVAFLEAESFEDAIRNIISIGGDSDTTGAITGSIAWTYYTAKGCDVSMQAIRAQAAAYLPKEFTEIAQKFAQVCSQRAGTYDRVGMCTSILNRKETLQYGADWVTPYTLPRMPSAGAEEVETVNWPRYTLEYIDAQTRKSEAWSVGTHSARHDPYMHHWHLRIQLEQEHLWYLSVFVRGDGRFEKYSLDEEAASDSHYEFTEEQNVRNALYIPGDEQRYFHEILIRYVCNHGGEALLSLIMPYVTQQIHF